VPDSAAGLFYVVAFIMDQNPYESPSAVVPRMGEGGIESNKPRSTVGGVIRLFVIVVGIMVAIALCDAFVVWLLSWMSR
jgi:hypothetical protein